MIESIYKRLLAQYEVEPSTSENFWKELNDLYSSNNRYYHNLNHLSDLFAEVQAVKSSINNWNIILFTLFYHDAIYKSTKKNNEEKSAELAIKRMTEIGFNQAEVQLCYDQIIATKSHARSEDSDTNYFTDADLSILGRDEKTYIAYCKNIRFEYAIYPEFMYKKGRRNVVKHFLSMDRIYKTDFFFDKYESHARENLRAELDVLG